ncbi:hypothetical protein PIB30_099935 [Stylosanthes scabra]|uniref:Uncharacterized protein n=1 Tax=Stylosanthes scabra TaxID=79078 RepID=A0ABU6WYP8_9FABA|nr:hypothetical protein [Stylosanthes scabra]
MVGEEGSCKKLDVDGFLRITIPTRTPMAMLFENSIPSPMLLLDPLALVHHIIITDDFLFALAAWPWLVNWEEEVLDMAQRESYREVNQEEDYWIKVAPELSSLIVFYIMSSSRFCEV